MALADDIVVLHAGFVHAERVDRNVHFFLADQLPGEAVQGAVVHVDLIVELVAVRAFVRVVIGDRRRTTHAPQGRRVQPGTAVVHMFPGHQEQAGITRRGENFGHVVDGHVVLVVDDRVVAGQVGVGEQHILTQRGLGVGAVRQHDELVVEALDGLAAVLQAVVPDDFGAVLRDREGKADFGAEQQVCAFQAGVGRILLGVLVILLREA